MICASLLLFAVSLASFAVVPPRVRVQNAESTVQSSATPQISKLNASNISITPSPINESSESSSAMKISVVSKMTQQPNPPNSVHQSISVPTSSTGLDLTLITSSFAYAAVLWSVMCTRGIFEALVFAVSLAAHVAGRRLYGWVQAAGALSAVVFSILYGCVLDRWQISTAAAGSQKLSGNESVPVNRSVMVPVRNYSEREAMEISVKKSDSEITSNYMLRFSIVIACGCVAFLLTALSVSFYRIAPRKVQKSVLRDVWNAIRNIQVVSIFLVIFVTGFLLNSHEGLFYWYIQDLGGSMFLVGLILALRKGVDIVGSLVGPIIVAQIGPQPAFLLVFAVHVLHFALLTTLPYTAHIQLSLGPLGPVRPAYWALPLESLHAITISLDRLLYSSELSAHSPASSISSLVAFGQSVQFGLGAGLVGLIQGVTYSTIGPQAFYALLSAVALSAGVLYALFQYCVLRSRSQEQRNREAGEFGVLQSTSTRR